LPPNPDLPCPGEEEVATRFEALGESEENKKGGGAVTGSMDKSAR
jgi:hypothetical protein